MPQYWLKPLGVTERRAHDVDVNLPLSLAAGTFHEGRDVRSQAHAVDHDRSWRSRARAFRTRRFHVAGRAAAACTEDSEQAGEAGAATAHTLRVRTTSREWSCRESRRDT
jgi:hypothetical protein